MDQSLNLNSTTSWLNIKFQKYFAVAKVNYRTYTSYLGDLTARGAVVVIRVWIFTALYTATYATVGARQINGFTVPMVVWTLGLAQSMIYGSGGQFVTKRVAEDVSSGNIAHNLTKPYSYILYNCFLNYGRISATVFGNVVLAVVALLILVGPISFSLPGFFAAILLFFLGLTLNTLMSFLIGLLAFWTEDVTPFRWIYNKAQIIFGGVILPLALFPPKLGHIAEYIPFSQLYYPAARILISFDFHIFVRNLIFQLAWILIMTLLCMFLFKKAAKNISINGG